MKRTRKARRPKAKAAPKKTALVRQIVDAHLTQAAGGNDYDSSIWWPCRRSCGSSPCSSSEA